MRYAIFSDIHSNLEALRALVKALNAEEIDCYLCVGDIVGYGANPNECIREVLTLNCHSVAGNHDWASVGLFSDDYFNPIAKEAVIWTRERIEKNLAQHLKDLPLVYQNKDLTLVHGTLVNPSDFDYMDREATARNSFPMLTTSICFVGHTHVSGVFIKDQSGEIKYTRAGKYFIEEGQSYIINVGSVGQPRDLNPNGSYCIYDTTKNEVLIKRFVYDVFGARKKIIENVCRDIWPIG